MSQKNCDVTYPQQIKYSISTADGGFAILYDNGIKKFGPDGTQQWDFNTGWDTRSLIQSNDAGFVIVGQDSNNAAIAKIDANGNLQWKQSAKVDPTAFFDIGTSVVQTKDNGYLLVGQPWGGEDNHHCIINISLYKFDATGNKLWDRDFHIASDLWESIAIFNVVETSDSGFLLIGGHSPSGIPDLYALTTVKIGSDGEYISQHIFDVTSSYDGG